VTDTDDHRGSAVHLGGRRESTERTLGMQVVGQSIAPVRTPPGQLREPGQHRGLSEQPGKRRQDRTMQGEAIREMSAQIGRNGTDTRNR